MKTKRTMKRTMVLRREKTRKERRRVGMKKQSQREVSATATRPTTPTLMLLPFNCD